MYLRLHKTDIVVWGNRHGHPKKLRVINKAPSDSLTHVEMLSSYMTEYSLFYDDKRFSECGPKNNKSKKGYNYKTSDY